MTITMSHLAVVLENGNVAGRGLQAQHTVELVVPLDRYLAQMVLLDAGARDALREATAEFLCQLRRGLLAQEAGDVLGE